MPILTRNSKVLTAAGKVLIREATPLDLPNLKMYLSARRTPTYSDGTAIDGWLDSSNNGNNATQLSATFKPTYEVNEFGINAGIKFDGVDDFMSIPPTILKNLSEYTVQIVFKRGVLGGVGNFLYISTSGGPSRLNCNMTTSSVNIALRMDDAGAVSTVSTISNDLLPHLLQVTVIASVAYFYLDGILRGTTILNASIISNTNSAPAQLGGSSGSFPNCFIEVISLNNSFSSPSTIQEQYGGYLYRGYL